MHLLLLNSLINWIFRAYFCTKLISYKSKLHQNWFHYREIHCFIHSCTFWKICYPILVNRVNKLLCDWFFYMRMSKIVNVILRIVFNKLPIIFYKRYLNFIFSIEVLCLIILGLMILIQKVFIIILIWSILCFTALVDTE